MPFGVIALSAALAGAMPPNAPHATACGCARFALASTGPATAPLVLTAQAIELRDFVLYTHRDIAADLIRRRGPYLATLSAFFPTCPDEPRKLAWFREQLALHPDTAHFAERISQQYLVTRNCPAP